MVVTFDSDTEMKPQKKRLNSGSLAKIEGVKSRNRGKSLNSKSFGKIDGSIGDGKRPQDEAINFLLKYTDGKYKKSDKEKEVERERKREPVKEIKRETKDTEDETEKEEEGHIERNVFDDLKDDMENRKDTNQSIKKRHSSSPRSHSKRLTENPEEVQLLDDEYVSAKDRDWDAPRDLRSKKSAWKVREEDMMAYKRSKNYYPIRDEEPPETSPYTKGLYITASLLAAGVTVAIVKNKFFS